MQEKWSEEESLKHLLHHLDTPGMNACHAAFDFGFEIAAT
jgi:hypothetical protein